MTFQSTTMRFVRVSGISLFGLLVSVGSIIGCNGRPQILPNRDKALNKTSAQFAADAAKRHPYKADAPRGGTIAGRAQTGYWVDVLDIANLSDADWENVEVWVNKKFVVGVPKMPAPKNGAPSLTHLTFQMLFDDAGNSFTTDNKKNRIETVEIYKDGKMYDVTTKLAD